MGTTAAGGRETDDSTRTAPIMPLTPLEGRALDFSDLTQWMAHMDQTIRHAGHTLGAVRAQIWQPESPPSMAPTPAAADHGDGGFRPFRRLWLRREVLPSIATMSGSPSRSSSTQARKQALNRLGSRAANTSHNVSWLGILRA